MIRKTKLQEHLATRLLVMYLENSTQKRSHIIQIQAIVPQLEFRRSNRQ